MNDKVEVTAKNQKFCSLCSRVIRRGERCYTFAHKDGRGKSHFGMFSIHLDCSHHKDDMHNIFFRENVKKRQPRRGRGAGKKRPGQVKRDVKTR